jgi:hypothetical protein
MAAESLAPSELNEPLRYGLPELRDQPSRPQKRKT